MPDRPVVGEVEQRSAPGEALSVDGRKLRGVIPFGIESRDLGGWTEIMAAGSLQGAQMADLVATVDHAGLPLARFPTTLAVEHQPDGFHWSLDLPESRSDVREAVERGDLKSCSWRMRVARDRWDGNVRHVEAVADLLDVSIVTTGAYGPAAPAEFRSASTTPPPDETPPEETATVPTTEEGTTGLRVEDRAAHTEPAERRIETRVLDAIRSVKKGEARSLTTAANSGGPITPPEMSTFLWDRLRPASVALASGVVVIPTDRNSVTWPQLTSDVDPDWYAELEQIGASDPGLDTLEATPHKLAHRISPISNEVIDDSEPSAVDVLSGHLATMLGLKFDRSVFEGNPSANADSIRGLKYVSGIQTVSMGTNGSALTNYDPIVKAVGKLRSANVPGPYAIVAHADVLTELELLKEATGSNVQLARPEALPPIATTSALATNETQGSASNARSVYVYAPAQLVIVRRQDATVELDRSRLFDTDASEMRAKLRADLIVPNPVAVVRITGVIPPA